MPNLSKLKSPLQALRDAFAPAADVLPTGNLPAVVPPATTEPAAGITRRELLGRAASAAARNALPDLGSAASVLGGSGSFAEGVAGQALKSGLTPQDYASAYPALFSLAHSAAKREGYKGESAIRAAETMLGEAMKVSDPAAVARHEEVFGKLPPRLRNEVWDNVGDGVYDGADNAEAYWDEGAPLTGSFLRNFRKHTGEDPIRWLQGNSGAVTDPTDVLGHFQLPEDYPLPSAPNPKLFFPVDNASISKWQELKAQHAAYNASHDAYNKAWQESPTFLARKEASDKAQRAYAASGYTVPPTSSAEADRKFYAQMKREVGSPPRFPFNKLQKEEFEKMQQWARAHGFFD